MSTPTTSLTRELDHRVSDGIEVRLLWRVHDDRLLVAVSDGRTGDAFSFEVRDGGRALDVFHHPYAYAATRRAQVHCGPPATFDDAVEASRIINRAYSDRGRFSAADQQTLTDLRADVRQVVAEGRAAFDNADVGTLLSGAARSVEIMTHATCDGCLSVSARARIAQFEKARAAQR